MRFPARALPLNMMFWCQRGAVSSRVNSLPGNGTAPSQHSSTCDSELAQRFDRA